MNVLRYSSALFVCGALVACGGNSPKPEVAPAPESAPAVASAVSAAPPAPAAEKKVELKTDEDRYSYALGMDLGKSIAGVNVPLNMDLLIQAIRDENDTTATVLMDDSSAEAALQSLLLKMQKQKEAEDAAAANKSLEDQKAFLAKNIQDSTVKVTPKGVQYRIIKDGTGISPKAADKVQVHYVGSLLDGTEFDNSVKRGEPLEFPVNAVIEGWQDLLQVLKEGSKVQAWIPSELGYGAAGVPPMIPGNALLVFEVELLKVYAEVPPAEEIPSVDSVNSGASAPAAESAPAAAPAADAKAAPAAEASKAAESAKPTKADSKKADSKPAKAAKKK